MAESRAGLERKRKSDVRRENQGWQRGWETQ